MNRYERIAWSWATFFLALATIGVVFDAEVISWMVPAIVSMLWAFMAVKERR